ncbi:hypothetical protein FRB99_004527 [Tulasnella sp. 403]|nr:hypothetical protein FRB99_004527 [Tulasnella sp. 403]
MALLAKLSGLLEPLRQFLETKPVWGTCAGAILLSREVVGTKKGGQEVLGCIDVKVGRNGWGSQVESFEAGLTVKGMRDAERPFQGVFIRAPVVLALLPTSPSRPPVEVIARLPDDILPSVDASPYLPAYQIEPNSLPTPPNETAPADDLRHIVALRQGRHLLTTFHPELTRDDRFHELFLKECVLAI